MKHWLTKQGCVTIYQARVTDDMFGKGQNTHNPCNEKVKGECCPKCYASPARAEVVGGFCEIQTLRCQYCGTEYEVVN